MAKVFSQIAFDFFPPENEVASPVSGESDIRGNGTVYEEAVKPEDLGEDAVAEEAGVTDEATERDPVLKADKANTAAEITAQEDPAAGSETTEQEPTLIVDEADAEPVVTFTPHPAVAKPSSRGRKSQKTYAAEAGRVNIPEDDILFQKQYYSIGEVSQMFNVNASLLRFWESEFDIIQPRKNRKGDRHFRPVDIRNLQLIYDLLRRRKLTIDGARDFLKNSKKSKERFEMIQSLQRIKSFLLEIKASL